MCVCVIPMYTSPSCSNCWVNSRVKDGTLGPAAGPEPLRQCMACAGPVEWNGTG